MIIFCEECGERYVVELGPIETSVITLFIVFTCGTCGDAIEASFPAAVHDLREEIEDKAAP
ncbi:MAG: hypothetical protein PHG91_08650 [Syntrophales bacterium]|nr:hypothetical protein [Syntrophales bacterium]MDD5233451.1 hypothetical protein [Syntrophales bacterium]MDD5532780.1 hypothetical protein [Syntrophales bacterium]HPL64026.1 hypothetical protein [Syntrophales bacterium]